MPPDPREVAGALVQSIILHGDFLVHGVPPGVRNQLKADGERLNEVGQTLHPFHRDLIQSGIGDGYRNDEVRIRAVLYTYVKELQKVDYSQFCTLFISQFGPNRRDGPQLDDSDSVQEKFSQEYVLSFQALGEPVSQGRNQGKRPWLEKLLSLKGREFVNSVKELPPLLKLPVAVAIVIWFSLEAVAKYRSAFPPAPAPGTGVKISEQGAEAVTENPTVGGNPAIELQNPLMLGKLPVFDRNKPLHIGLHHKFTPTEYEVYWQRDRGDQSKRFFVPDPDTGGTRPGYSLACPKESALWPLGVNRIYVSKRNSQDSPLCSSYIAAENLLYVGDRPPENLGMTFSGHVQRNQSSGEITIGGGDGVSTISFQDLPDRTKCSLYLEYEVLASQGSSKQFLRATSRNTVVFTEERPSQGSLEIYEGRDRGDPVQIPASFLAGSIRKVFLHQDGLSFSVALGDDPSQELATHYNQRTGNSKVEVKVQGQKIRIIKLVRCNLVRRLKVNK